MNMNKIGFNNFKAFGEKMQYFSKKPITLVYGPNSIGKSSFLHSQLYLEYLRNNGTKRDLDKTNFAGDELNLGGFINFIHKNDLDHTVKYELVYSEQDDIERLFNLNFDKMKKLKRLGLLNDNITLEYIESKLENNLHNKTFTKKNLLEIIINNRKLNKLYEFKKVFMDKNLNETINNYEEIHKINKKVLFAEFCHKNCFNLKDYIDENDTIIFSSDFKKIYKSSIEEIKNLDDMIIQLSILFGSVKPQDILDRLELFRYISEINEIKLLIELKKEESVVQSFLKYSINNELIFDSKEIDSNHSTINPNRNARLYNILNKYLNENYVPLGNVEKTIDVDTLKLKNIYDHDNEHMGHFLAYSLQNEMLINFDKNIFQSASVNNAIHILMGSAIAFLNNIDITVKNQYFGPLRFYPQRWDLFEKNKEQANLNAGNKEDSPQIKDSIMYKTPLLYINMPFWIYMIKNGAYNDAINHILPNKMKLSSRGAYSSEKMWSRLIQSKEIQVKLNKWFSDESKLKTPYEIMEHEYDIKYNKVYKFFRKIFGIKQETEKSIFFVDRRTDTEVTPRDMGLGVSQVLPILVSCLNSKKTNIFIEQPELHLHPAVQGELADEFIQSYKERDNKFVIETHSEHLLLRIMKRMRYTAEDKQYRDKTLDLTPEDVCLLYVDNDGESTYIKELRLSSKGKLLDHWPNGFFEEGFKERFS